MSHPIGGHFAIDSRCQKNRRRHEGDEVVTAAEDQSISVRHKVLEVVGYEIVEEAARHDDEHNRRQTVDDDLHDEPEREFVVALTILIRRERRKRSQHYIGWTERVAGVLVDWR